MSRCGVVRVPELACPLGLAVRNCPPCPRYRSCIDEAYRVLRVAVREAERVGVADGA